MTDVAQLNFAVDSSQARDARTHLEELRASAKGTEQDLVGVHSGSMQAGAGLAGFSSQLGFAKGQLALYAGSLDDVIARLQTARQALDGTAASFATFETARQSAEALAGAMGTGAVAMEAFARQASTFQMTAGETAGALARITAAMQGQTEAGRQLRTIMAEYGVTLQGLNANQADKALQQFVTNYRQYSPSAANLQALQQVLGVMGPEQLAEIQYPNYESPEARDNRLRLQDTNRESNAVQDQVSRQMRQIQTRNQELEYLQGRYGILPRSSSLLPGWAGGGFDAAQLMQAMHPFDGGGMAPSAEDREAEYRRLVGTVDGRLDVYRFMDSHRDDPTGRRLRGLGGRLDDYYRQTPLFDLLNGRDTPIFSGLDSIAERNRAQAEQNYNAGIPGWSNSPLGRNLNYYWEMLSPRLFSPFSRPVLPPLSPEAQQQSMVDEFKQDETDASLLGDYGLSGASSRFGARQRLFGLDANSDNVRKALERTYGGTAAPTVLANLRAELQRQQRNGIDPSASQVDEQALRAWVQSLAPENRGLAQQLMGVAQANNVDTSVWATNGVTPDQLMSGALNGQAGGLTDAMRADATKLQAGDTSLFVSKSDEQAAQQVQIQQQLQGAIKEGAQAVQQAQTYWQTYFQVLDGPGGNVIKATTAAINAQNEALERNKTAAQTAMHALTRDTDAQTALAFTGSVGAGADWQRGMTLTGLDNDVIVQRELYGANFNELEYRGQRQRGFAARGVSAGNERVQSAAMQLQGGTDNLLIAGAPLAAQKEMNNALQTQREFVKEIADAQASGNAAAVEQVRRQIDAVTQLKNAYDVAAKAAQNLNFARDTENRAALDRFEAGIKDPTERERFHNQRPFLEQNMDNPRLTGSNMAGLPAGIGFRASQYEADFQTASTLTGNRIPPQVLAVLGYREGSLMADPPIGTGGTAHRGMMQFSVATGVDNGLVINNDTDQRLDPHRAIPASGRYLNKLLDRAGINGPVTSFEQLKPILNGGGYGSSEDADTETLYRLAFEASKRGISLQEMLQRAKEDPTLAPGLNASDEALAATKQLQNQQANDTRDYNARVAGVRMRALDQNQGQIGADIGGAMVLDPRQTMLQQEEAARRLSTQLEGLNSKYAEQSAAARQALSDSEGLSHAWQNGSYAAEVYQKQMGNNTQLRQLEAVGDQYPQLRQQLRPMIERLQFDNARAPMLVSADAGRQFAQQTDALAQENSHLQMRIDAGPFAGRRELDDIDTSFQAQQIFQKGHPTDDQGQPISQEQIEAILKANQAMKESSSQMDKIRSNFDQFGDSVMRNFESAITGGERFRDMLHSIAEDLEKTLLRSFVEQPLTNAFQGLMGQATSGLGGALGGLLGFGKQAASSAAGASAASSIVDAGGWDMLAATGTVMQNARPTRYFATGGMMLDRPTRFMADGGPVVAGEAGPEAVVPLRRMSNGNLGIQTSGNGGGHTIIVQAPVTIQGGGGKGGGGMDPATMKAMSAQIEMMHTKAIRAAMADQMRDGGDLSNAVPRSWN